MQNEGKKKKKKVWVEAVTREREHPTAMTTTATMAATSSILILAILAGSLLPSGAQFADPPPPSNETMPDSITVVDVGNDTTAAMPEVPAITIVEFVDWSRSPIPHLRCHLPRPHCEFPQVPKMTAWAVR